MLNGNEILQNEITGTQTSFSTNCGGKLKIDGEFPVANCYRCKCITQYTDKRRVSHEAEDFKARTAAMVWNMALLLT
jgi:hypothetical protein